MTVPSSEISLYSLNSLPHGQMRRDDNPCISLVEHLPSEPSRLTVNILIGNELLNVAAPIIDASLAIRLIGVKNQLTGSDRFSLFHCFRLALILIKYYSCISVVVVNAE